MTIKEALSIFKSKHSNLVIQSCYEYDSRFVFHAIHPKYLDIAENDIVFDSLYSVDKKTKKLTAFKPFDISIDEYNRGKKIDLNKIANP